MPKASRALTPQDTVDDRMSDMEALGSELAGERLRQAAQGEFGCAEGGELGAGLDRGGRADEEQGALPRAQHAGQDALRPLNCPETGGAPERLEGPQGRVQEGLTEKAQTS
jgi:hypothetical protein